MSSFPEGKKRKKREREKHGKPQAREGRGEGCETVRRGQPEVGVWQGRAEQRACVQPSRWGEGGTEEPLA